MNNLQKILGIGALALSLTGCAGKIETNYQKNSKPKTEEVKQKVPEVRSYFAEIPTNNESGITMTTGDFDGDGNLDLIVGAYKANTGTARLYFFKGDGKGNFKLGTYSSDK